MSTNADVATKPHWKFLINAKLRKLFPPLFPVTWRRLPDNPLYRYMGYDQLRLLNPEPNRLRDILWIVRPSFSRVPIAKEYWRESVPPLDAESHGFWTEETGLKVEDELKQHFHAIRDLAWQVVQEFTIARWWFLRSVMAKNPYYDEVKNMARLGATVVDLGCGFGQELRRLRADGATGELYGVDLHDDMWNLGLRLFRDDQEWTGRFRKADIISRYNQKNPLAEFTDNVDVFLLNDVISFWGLSNIFGVLESIDKTSRVGSKILGWVVGQEGDESMRGMQVAGDCLRGCIPTPTELGSWLPNSEFCPENIWNTEMRLIEFEKLGFDKEDQDWFASDFFHRSPTIAEPPNELKALCFLATRIS